MATVRLLWPALIACATLACASHAPDGFDARVGSSRADLTDAAFLREFEREAESDVYRLGPGDEITIDTWDRPDLSGAHVIGPDGRITLPVAGPIGLDGLSRTEAAEAVTGQLGRFFNDTVVTVRVDRYGGNRIFVLGRVAQPGLIAFDSPPTLLETITRAGGLPVGGIGADKASLTRCAVFRGRDRVVWIDLKSLLTGANLALNLRLRSNDIVYIPDANDQLVYALGEVERPGAYGLTPNMSLLDLLAQAGGTTKDASAGRLHIIRPSEGWNREFSLSDLLAPDPSLNVVLEEGDVLYVPRRTLAKVGYVLGQLGYASGFLFFGSVLADPNGEAARQPDGAVRDAATTPQVVRRPPPHR